MQNLPEPMVPADCDLSMKIIMQMNFAAAKAAFKKPNLKRKRSVSIALATPKWLSNDQLYAIAELYSEAKALTIEKGFLHHVDHIIPLLGKNVCGLHVSWNLQVITALENIKKSNKVFVS
jgi:hypothetical protein